jgi:hypothetical protein
MLHADHAQPLKFPLGTGTSATVHDSNSEKPSRSARIYRPTPITAHSPPHSRLPGWRSRETDTGRHSKNPKNACKHTERPERKKRRSQPSQACKEIGWFDGTYHRVPRQKLIVAFAFRRLLDRRSGKNEHRIGLREFVDGPIVLLPLIASVDGMECLGPPNNKEEHLVGLVGQPNGVHAKRHA